MAPNLKDSVGSRGSGWWFRVGTFLGQSPMRPNGNSFLSGLGLPKNRWCTLWTYVSNCLDLAFPGLDLPRSVASISSYISLRVAFESAAQGFCPSKGWCGILKPDTIFQTEEEFCDDAGRDSRSGSTQWLGNMQPLWSPGSPPESTKNHGNQDFGVPTCDKKWQFSLGQLDSVKKTEICLLVCESKGGHILTIG